MPLQETQDFQEEMVFVVKKALQVCLVFLDQSASLALKELQILASSSLAIAKLNNFLDVPIIPSHYGQVTAYYTSKETNAPMAKTSATQGLV